MIHSEINMTPTRNQRTANNAPAIFFSLHKSQVQIFSVIRPTKWGGGSELEFANFAA
jgi:hypothetical protein